ncbi:alpha/beta hydrolase [Salinicola tamaricis]|uniref:alpha/beta fold hydrolase n=1 Tax=Salinicola tamaricis TaxID=1771309 RepID=UPI0030F48B75
MLPHPLVFAHANGFTGASYRTLLAPLDERFELHVLERLAHHPDFPVDRNWRSLCDEYLDAVRAVGRPVIAVGHSMGGVLSIMGACRAPEHFRAVVALDPPLLIGRDALLLKLAKLTGFIDRITPAGKTLKRPSAGRAARQCVIRCVSTRCSRGSPRRRWPTTSAVPLSSMSKGRPAAVRTAS